VDAASAVGEMVLAFTAGASLLLLTSGSLLLASGSLSVAVGASTSFGGNDDVETGAKGAVSFFLSFFLRADSFFRLRLRMLIKLVVVRSKILSTLAAVVLADL
jgi:hypothetical protein